MMALGNPARIYTAFARRALALALSLFAVSSLACAQTLPKYGEWVLSKGTLATKDFKLVLGSPSSEALALLGEPPSSEPWPFHYSFQYAGFLSLDYSDSNGKLTGVRFYFEKGMEGEGEVPEIPMDLVTAEVFGIRVDDASTFADIEKRAKDRGVLVVGKEAGEKIGLSDGIYIAWFYCEKDQGGDLHSMEYFKLPD